MRKYIFCILCVLVVFAAALAVTADTSIALTERAHVVPLPDGGTVYMDFYKGNSNGDGQIFCRIIEDPAVLQAASYYNIHSASILNNMNNSIWYVHQGSSCYPSFLGNEWRSVTVSQAPKSAKAVYVQFSRDGDIEVAVLSISKN